MTTNRHTPTRTVGYTISRVGRRGSRATSNVKANQPYATPRRAALPQRRTSSSRKPHARVRGPAPAPGLSVTGYGSERRFVSDDDRSPNAVSRRCSASICSFVIVCKLDAIIAMLHWVIIECHTQAHAFRLVDLTKSTVVVGRAPVLFGLIWCHIVRRYVRPSWRNAFNGRCQRHFVFLDVRIIT
jgi:hypothetical protein